MRFLQKEILLLIGILCCLAASPRPINALPPHTDITIVNSTNEDIEVGLLYFHRSSFYEFCWIKIQSKKSWKLNTWPWSSKAVYWIVVKQGNKPIDSWSKLERNKTVQCKADTVFLRNKKDEAKILNKLPAKYRARLLEELLKSNWKNLLKHHVDAKKYPALRIQVDGRSWTLGTLTVGEGIYRFGTRKGSTADAVMIRMLVDSLKDTDAGVRAKAALDLRTAGKSAKAALPVLLSAIKDNDVKVRIAVAKTLMKVAPDQQKVHSALIVALKDLDPTVRAAVADALSTPDRYGRISVGQIAVQPLLETLKDKDANVRAAAVRALSRIGPKHQDVHKAFAPMLKDTDAKVRVSAAEAIGRTGAAKDYVPALLATLEDKNTRVRTAAIAALGRAGDKAKPAVPRLLAFLKHPELSLRCASAQALGMIRSERQVILPALLKATKDKNSSVRMFVLRSLRAIDPKGQSTWNAHLAALKDPKVRGSVLYFFSNLGSELRPKTKTLLPALIAVLKDRPPNGKEGWRERENRIKVFKLLYRMGRDAKAAVPDLIQIWKEQTRKRNRYNVLTRYLARAIWRIDPKSARKARVRYAR